MGKVVVRGALWLLALATAITLIAPVLVIVPMSFSDSSYLAFPPEKFSTRWYANYFNDPTWREATANSAKIATLVTISAALLGTAAAMGLVRGQMKFKGLIAGLVVAPLVVPYVIVGLAVYAAALELGLTQTTLGFVLVHTALAVPYVTVNVAAALASYDRRLEQAAMNLGASPLSTFMRITLPIIAPSVAAGALFAFVTSWDEVVVSLFLSGPEVTTLPVKMWSGVRVSIDPTVTAVSSLLLLLTLTAFGLAGITRLFRSRRIARSNS
jgi:putative spermidine/putrescine transport system permease protein